MSLSKFEKALICLQCTKDAYCVTLNPQRCGKIEVRAMTDRSGRHIVIDDPDQQIQPDLWLGCIGRYGKGLDFCQACKIAWKCKEIQRSG